jgi:lysyl-tRNA synthetase class 1
MLKTDLARAVNIRPEAIPDMIDEFERFERVYYGLEKADDEMKTLAQIVYPLALTGPVSEDYIPKLPFKFAVVMSQLEDLLGMDTIVARSEEAVKQQYDLETIPEMAKKRIPVRLKRAQKWVEMFGSRRDRIQVPDEIPKQIMSTLTPEDLTFLREILSLLEKGPLKDEEIQTGVFETANELDFKIKRAFTVLYRVLISSKSGPRLGPFINMLGREWVIERIEKALESK